MQASQTGQTGQTRQTAQLDRAAQGAVGRRVSKYGPERLLRQALRVNAVSSAATGLFGLVFAGTTGDLIGVEQEWLIRLVGGALFLFAVGVFVLSLADLNLLTSGAVVISMNDFGWVLATAVVIGLGWLSTQGAVLMGLIAVAVFDFGAVQLLARRGLKAES